MPPKAPTIFPAGSSGRIPPNFQVSSQTAPNGHAPPRSQPRSLILTERNGSQNPQPPARLAPTDPGLARSQPVLSVSNGRVPSGTPAHTNSIRKKNKEDIPYEIKNAREWDPKRRLQAASSSESSDDDDYYDSEYDEHPQVFGDVSSTVADDKFQPVINRRFQSNARPHDRPPAHLKAYPHGKPSGQRRARPRGNLNYKGDNPARAAFRKRLDSTARFMLPRDCHDIEPNQKNMYDMFNEMGVRLGSFIRPPQHMKDRELLLWGDTHQVQATKAELERWLVNRLQLPQKSMAKDKFAREYSTIGNQYHRSMKKLIKEAKISEFQQVPAEGRIFSYTGTFLWPIDEVRPEDILGSSLEAFDPIRFQYHCHIVFDNKLAAFRIYSDKEESVKQTMERIVGTMSEYVAKSARPDVVILLEPPKSSAIRKDVKIFPVSFRDSKADMSMIPVLAGSTLDPEARNEWLEKSNQLTMKNNCRLEISLRKCIANLRHYRGLVRMRVQFGTFALKVFRWKEGADSTPFEDFANNLTMSGTKGVMIRDLRFQKDAATIITRFHKATGLFLPMDSISTSLAEIRPSFSACFEFKHPNSPPMNFTLEMSSSPAAPTIYEPVQGLWTRSDRRDNAVPLEVFQARIDGGASWKLQVSTENSIDSSRINPKMTAFAESVQLSKIPNTKTELTGQRVFKWDKNQRAMQPLAFQQKTALKYRLVHQPEWEFEIARYDHYGNPRNENVPVETNWGATLYNTNWDSVLTANSTLDIGEAAEWHPALETFFPSRPGAADTEGVEGADLGVTEFLKNVEVVTAFIDSIKQ